MDAWWMVYLGSGVLVFLLLRGVAWRARVRVATHDAIWTFWIWDPEAWVLGILLWPLLALGALVWVVAEVFHRAGMRRDAEREAKRKQELRENPYRGLPLDELLSAVDVARKEQSEKK